MSGKRKGYGGDMIMASAQDLIPWFTDTIATAGIIAFYLVVWGLVFAGTGLFVGAFIPFITGDTLLFASGLLAAEIDGVDIVVLAMGTGIAAFLGDQLGFVMGRNLGRPYLDARTGVRMAAIVTSVEAMYSRYGWWSVVVARFVPWARVFVPWVAGIGRMNYYRFLTSNATGAILWGVGLTVAGWGAYFIPGVKSAAYVIAGVVIAMSLVAGYRTWRANRASEGA
jgi:membrane-associated protein